MKDEKLLLELKDVKKYFPIKGKGIFRGKVGDVKAVDGVSFQLMEKETLGVVGESGSGKSTLARTIIRLYDGIQGEILFQGKDIANLSSRELNPIRENMQMIFQDPYSSLNPKMTAGEIIGETLVNNKFKGSKKELKQKVIETMELCGLPSYHYGRYPHEFSGGQRQRIGIARALIIKPKLIIADEPTSALDVSIQAQIINLLTDLQKELDFSYIFISHDLGVVEYISTKVAVMYLGNFVEMASKEELYKNTMHPYTKSLLSAVPISNPKEKKDRIILKGDIPSPANPPKGCRFNPRCPYAKEICKENRPEFEDKGNNHFVACHFAGEIQW